MATRYYAYNPGNHLEDIVEQAGSANSSALVELSIDLKSTGVADSGMITGTSRVISKNEVLIGLDLFMQQIIRDTSGVLS